MAPTFDTIGAACAASAQAERDNISIYDRLLTGDVPEDVRVVFGRLREAS